MQFISLELLAVHFSPPQSFVFSLTYIFLQLSDLYYTAQVRYLS